LNRACKGLWVTYREYTKLTSERARYAGLGARIF
jgi:hypothetical protein